VSLSLLSLNKEERSYENDRERSEAVSPSCRGERVKPLDQRERSERARPSERVFEVEEKEKEGIFRLSLQLSRIDSSIVFPDSEGSFLLLED